MLLNFDIDEAAIAEHDDWHTHEHLPERLSIPGFLRGTRWVAVRGSPRYTVLYEVDDHIATTGYTVRTAMEPTIHTPVTGIHHTRPAPP